MAPLASPWTTSGTVPKEGGWLPQSPSEGPAALDPQPDRLRHEAQGIAHGEREVLHVAPEPLPEFSRACLRPHLLRQDAAGQYGLAGLPGVPWPHPHPGMERSAVVGKKEQDRPAEVEPRGGGKRVQHDLG